MSASQTHFLQLFDVLDFKLSRQLGRETLNMMQLWSGELVGWASGRSLSLALECIRRGCGVLASRVKK